MRRWIGPEEDVMCSLHLPERLEVAAFELILVGAPRWMVIDVYEAAYG
jgi:hypothetical protein